MQSREFTISTHGKPTNILKGKKAHQDNVLPLWRGELLTTENFLNFQKISKTYL